MNIDIWAAKDAMTDVSVSSDVSLLSICFVQDGDTESVLSAIRVPPQHGACELDVLTLFVDGTTDSRLVARGPIEEAMRNPTVVDRLNVWAQERLLSLCEVFFKKEPTVNIIMLDKPRADLQQIPPCPGIPSGLYWSFVIRAALYSGHTPDEDKYALVDSWGNLFR